MSSNNRKYNKSTLVILFVLLLFFGLSPINEPHIIGKIKWVNGGAIGMKPMDWFDLFLHGTSLLISLLILLRIFVQFFKKQ